MNLSEIESLIKIRDYVDRMVNNFNLEKSVVNDLRSMSILLDNKIVNFLLDKEFKNYIDFGTAKEAVKKVAEINNVKHSFKTQQDAKNKIALERQESLNTLNENAATMSEMIMTSSNKIINETK